MTTRGCGSQGEASGCGGCSGAASTVPLDPRQMTIAERRRWLESYRRHLEERLAEVNEQLEQL